VSKPPGAASQVHDGIEVYVPLGDLIDAAAEARRLKAEGERLAKLQAAAKTKLENEQFLTRAPAEIVERQREQVAKLTEQLTAVEGHLADLQ
jgi:valyl-tRNA synthetase